MFHDFSDIQAQTFVLDAFFQPIPKCFPSASLKYRLLELDMARDAPSSRIESAQIELKTPFLFILKQETGSKGAKKILFVNVSCRKVQLYLYVFHWLIAWPIFVPDLLLGNFP